MNALERAIHTWKCSSIETFELAIHLWPSHDSIPVFDKKDNWLGLDKYIIQVFGQETRPISVRLGSRDRVWVKLDDIWVPVSDALDALNCSKADDSDDKQPITYRNHKLKKWWAVNGKTFNFLGLPPEIRELIYGFMFGSNVEAFDSRGSKARKYQTLFQREQLGSLLRVDHLVRREARHVLFERTLFSTHSYSDTNRLLSSLQPRIQIRKLEISLSNEHFFRLFGGLPVKDGEISCPLKAAKALRTMELDELRLRIELPNLFSDGPMDNGCHKKVVEWILEVAWPFIRGHPVKIVGAIRTKQKYAYQAACREQREEFLLWRRQRVAVGESEGTLSDWDDDVEELQDESEEGNEGGVQLENGDALGKMPEKKSVKKWRPGKVNITADPPCCVCRPRCSKRDWRYDDE